MKFAKRATKQPDFSVFEPKITGNRHKTGPKSEKWASKRPDNAVFAVFDHFSILFAPCDAPLSLCLSAFWLYVNNCHIAPRPRSLYFDDEESRPAIRHHAAASACENNVAEKR